MGSNVWEWGPLSAVFQTTFVNDGTYTPVFTLTPNPQSSIIASAAAILEARGFSGALAGVSLRRDPGANIEMSYPLAHDADASTVVTFNLLTPSVKKLYPGRYAAEVAAPYGAGRSVKFNYDVLDYLQNYATVWYSPLSATGFPQGEAAEAMIEASIIWAANSDGSVAHSIDSTTYAVGVGEGNRHQGSPDGREQRQHVHDGHRALHAGEPVGRLGEVLVYGWRAHDAAPEAQLLVLVRSQAQFRRVRRRSGLRLRLPVDHETSLDVRNDLPRRHRRHALILAQAARFRARGPGAAPGASSIARGNDANLGWATQRARLLLAVGDLDQW